MSPILTPFNAVNLHFETLNSFAVFLTLNFSPCRFIFNLIRMTWVEVSFRPSFYVIFLKLFKSFFTAGLFMTVSASHCKLPISNYTTDYSFYHNQDVKHILDLHLLLE